MAKSRKDIGLQRGEPLSFVLFILERRSVRLVNRRRRLFESWRHGRSAAALRKRILAVARFATDAPRFFARFRQRNQSHGAKTDVAPLTQNYGAHEPPLRSRFVDDEIEAVPV